MSLTTRSFFTYGHTIDQSNYFIDFDEGASEISAEIEIGSYTLADFIDAISVALNDVGGQDYTVSLNRTTRKVTISATSNFTLRVTTGTHNTISAFGLIGFTSNKTGSNSYVADVECGDAYYPQYSLQKYVDFDDFVETVDSSVNKSASGKVEVISFGQNKFMECNIMYATDIVGQGVITDNASGVSDLRDFMNYLIKKRPVEFIKDIDSPDVFTSCILESTRQSSSGTGFQLYEMYSKGLAFYFETQALKFREV